MGIDGEGTNSWVDQSLPAIFVRANRRLRRRDAQVMILVLKTDRVVEKEPAIVIRHFGRPEIAAERGIGPDERVAGELPMEQIGRTENGKNFADRMPGGFQFARANSVVVVLVFPDE